MFDEDIFKNKKPNFQKLIEYGFCTDNNLYTYTVPIVDQQFYMTVKVTESGIVKTEVIDRDTEEQYVLHLSELAAGPFVGTIKKEHDSVLKSIADDCFESDVFKSSFSHSIINYVRETYNDELEFLWSRFPNNAILRHKDTKKWYAVLLTVSKRKIGIDSDDIIEIIDLHLSPQNILSVVDNKKYFPGYHMNKKHWCTICLDGSVSLNEIYMRIDESYKLAAK